MSTSTKIVNGYASPKFRIYYGQNAYNDYTFSFKYQGLLESIEETFVEHIIIDGTISKKFLYFHRIFEIDFSGLIESEDTNKVQILLNAIYSGIPVYLFPHSDHTRNFLITSTGEDKQLGLHYGGVNAGGNKDLILKFKTVNPEYNLNWTPADYTTGGWVFPILEGSLS